MGVGNFGRFNLKTVVEYTAAMYESKSWKANADDESLTHSLLSHMAAYVSDKKCDSKPAIELATKFCEETRWTNSAYVLGLAAIYASADNGTMAAKFAAQAVELAPESQKPVYNQYLENYRAQVENENYRKKNRLN